MSMGRQGVILYNNDYYDVYGDNDDYNGDYGDDDDDGWGKMSAMMTMVIMMMML